MLNKIKEEKVVAVIRAKDHDEALKYVDAIIKGGMTAIELTYSIPDVCPLIKVVKDRHPNALVGIGSVLTKQMAMDAIDAGASYIVSPGFSKDVNDYCKSVGMIYMPGSMTLTEIMNSMNEGNEIIKLFPGSEFSIGYIKSVLAPIPHAKLMVTGGVDDTNITEWLDAGVKVVGIGSSFTKLGDKGDFEGVEKMAAKLKELVK